MLTQPTSQFSPPIAACQVTKKEEGVLKERAHHYKGPACPHPIFFKHRCQKASALLHDKQPLRKPRMSYRKKNLHPKVTTKFPWMMQLEAMGRHVVWHHLSYFLSFWKMGFETDNYIIVQGFLFEGSTIQVKRASLSRWKAAVAKWGCRQGRTPMTHN